MADTATFITGIPKGEYRIRLKLADIDACGDIAALLSEYNLSSQMQDDGYLLVYGEKENVKSLLKELRHRINPDEPGWTRIDPDGPG